MRTMTKRTQVLVLASLCAASIAFWWFPLVATFRLALTNDAYTHILLILPLSAALVYMDSKAFPISPRPNPVLGTSLLVVAFLLGCYARWGGTAAEPDLTRLSLGMFSLVIWWIASVVFCYGAKTFKLFMFPLCFLFLIVPIPEFALTPIIEFLQQQSASVARVIFRLVGVPATQDGVMVSIPGLDIEVARECSSIRSSLMLVVITTVLAQLFLRTWWRKALLMIAAIPLSVAKNGLRIFTIAELATRVDRGFLDGKLHHHGGIIFLGLSVMVVCVLLWLLRRTELLWPKLC
jgi:exosortase